MVTVTDSFVVHTTEGTEQTVTGVTYKVGSADASTTAPAGISLSDHSLTGDPTNAAFDHLKACATESILVSYEVSDGKVTVAQTETITITGTNDVASITGKATGAVTEDATPNSIGGQLTVADADDGEASFEAPASLAGTYGTFTFDTATGAWTYTLANGTPAVDKLQGGQSVTDQLVVTSFDGTDDQTISVSITGANDKTVLSAITPASSSVTEAGTATAQDLGAITGTLTFTDLDAGDTLAASVVGTPTLTLNGNALTGSQAALLEAALVDGKLTFDAGVTSNGGEQTLGYSYDAAAANLDFLNADDSLVVSYQVKVGDSDTRTLSFTITGTNDAPTVAAALTDAADEGAGSVTRNLLEGASDLDNGAVLTVTGVTYKVGSAAASATIPAGISLSDHSLTVDPTNAAFDHLKAGATETIVVSYEVSDGKVTVAQTETITITGTNDKTILSAITSPASVAELGDASA
ncbi:VCBS domain-containing protein, partial [Methylobacterium sp. E-045]|uniref:VCBS domain-containing protein n=1 Tax=Methylobacterium sp. E-045 TaxID=2836575 RepID=UPI001FBBAB84